MGPNPPVLLRLPGPGLLGQRLESEGMRKGPGGDGPTGLVQGQQQLLGTIACPPWAGRAADTECGLCFATRARPLSRWEARHSGSPPACAPHTSCQRETETVRARVQFSQAGANPVSAGKGSRECGRVGRAVLPGDPHVCLSPGPPLEMGQPHREGSPTGRRAPGQGPWAGSSGWALREDARDRSSPGGGLLGPRPEHCGQTPQRPPAPSHPPPGRGGTGGCLAHLQDGRGPPHRT